MKASVNASDFHNADIVAANTMIVRDYSTNSVAENILHCCTALREFLLCLEYVYIKHKAN